mmetsp:Transcript_48872/g.129219  ORF Transcript_48872/g.129219 Transcript_48872/m.129219 type:complete len:369 (+) Transcript_48872:32-1138(+)
MASVIDWCLGWFDSCSPSQGYGIEPDFLASAKSKAHISHRDPTKLVVSEYPEGALYLYLHHWPVRNEEHPRAIVFIHHGELEHGGWYNGLANRLSQLECAVFAHDVQGHGQSDGCRGYFESFSHLVKDFVTVIQHKYDSVPQNAEGSPPRLVLIGKGMGALVALHAALLMREKLPSAEPPMVICLGSGFRFTNMVERRLAPEACGRCAQGPTPAAEPSEQKILKHLSEWFPKVHATPAIDPGQVTRDPQSAQRMKDDRLCNRQGYRARCFCEVLGAQERLHEVMRDREDLLGDTPALFLHGSQDRLYSLNAVEAIHELWSESCAEKARRPKLIVYEDAYHQLLNEPNPDQVVRDILSWIASFVYPQTS